MMSWLTGCQSLHYVLAARMSHCLFEPLALVAPSPGKTAQFLSVHLLSVLNARLCGYLCAVVVLFMKGIQ